MEDPEEEWGMEEYYPCSSGEEESKSKVSWIWNRGLKIGKKVVITGVVISSAPLVLPPLVVVSALGFAVSVPFGVVFASYACTEKLMSKLLPMPGPSPFLEYESWLMGETEEEESDFGGEFVMEDEVKMQIEDKKDFGGEFVMEDEVKMQIEDKKADMRTELVEYRDKDQQEEYVGENESFKYKGYEEDVGEYMEGGDEGSFGGANVKTEESKKPSVEESKQEKPSPEVKRVIVVVGEEKKNADDMRKTDELVVVARGVKSDSRDVEKLTGNEEHNKQKEGTTGLVEKIRDEGHAGESVKKNKKKNKHHGKKSHGIVGKKEDKHGKDAEEKMHEEIGRKRDEAVPDAKKKSGKGAAEGVTTKDAVVVDRNTVVVPLKPVGDQRTSRNGNHAAENRKTMEAKQEPGAGIQESRVESVAVDEKGGKLVGSNEKRRETDEKSIDDKNVDDSVQAGFPESKRESSNEIPLSEEKIWDEINAMRTIVGYKAARDRSYIEELKALYIFTGVEPPSSFDKSLDLKDAEDKLHFLMSIVGVK